MKYRFLFLLLQVIPILVVGQVNLPSGNAEFSLPVFNWQDSKSRLNTLVAINYSSGSGLKVNSVASNIGQGWNMIAGGVITRLQAGEPDDQKPYEGNGSSEDITKYPAGYLYDTTTRPGYSSHITKYPLYKDRNHIYKQHNVTAADKQMDQFAFQFNGRSGIFVLGKSRTSEDVAFLGDGKLKLWYDIDESLWQQGIRTTITAFHIRDDQGLVYTFSIKETVRVLKTVYTDKNGTGTLTQPNFKEGKVYYEKAVEGNNNEIKNPLVVMAWHLEKIEDPLTGRSIRFYYHYNQVRAQAGVSFSHNAKPRIFPVTYPETYSIVTRFLSHTDVPTIDSIVLPDEHRVTFTYGSNRYDLNGDKILTSISIKNQSRYLSKYLIKTSYVIRNRYGTPASEFQEKSARLFLRSVTKLGPDLKGDEKPYTFDYYLGSGAAYDFVPPPFYHLKDNWGYYNGDNSRSASNGLIDPEKPLSKLNNLEIRGLCFLRGMENSSATVLNVKDGMAKNGLLRQINFPEGASLQYEYAQNKAVLNSQLTSVGGVHVSKVTTTDGGYANDCNNPITTAYQYMMADGVQPSYWGVETPVHSVSMLNKYNPEKKFFDAWKLGCDHVYKYPGIASRENAISLTNAQKALVVLSNIATAVSNVSLILDIMAAATGVGPAALIIDAIFIVINVVTTCFTDPGINTDMDVYYNQDLNGVNPLPMQFKRVEVEQGDGSQGKTVYEFTSPDEYPVWFADNPIYSMKQRYAYWAYGLPKRTAVFDAAGNKLSESIHYYDTTYARRRIEGCPPQYAAGQKQSMAKPAAVPCDITRYTGYKDMIVTNKSQRSTVWDNPAHYDNQVYVTDMISNPDLKVDGYYIYTGRFMLQKTISRIYKKNTGSQFAQTITEYSYNNADCLSCLYKNYEVDEVKVIHPNGDTTYQTFRYDHPYLYENGIFTVPFQTTTSFKKAGSTIRYFTAENVTEFAYAPNGNIVPWKIKTQRFETPQPSTQMHTYVPIGDSYPGYQVMKTFFYDSYGNLAGQKDEGNRTVSYMYDYNDQYVTATIIGSDAISDKVSYTSFETDDFSRTGWSFTGTKLYANSGVTGYHSIILSSGKSLTAQLNTGKSYLLSFWAMAQMSVSGGAVLVKSSPTVNGFTFYEYKINAGASAISITGSGNMDEVRLYPANARMQTTAYDLLLGKISECDQNNRITHYEYDNLGRLRFIKDEKRDVIKMYEYSQKTVHDNCGNTYQNLAVSEVFTKNNCGAGYIGSEVIYTIPAGKYTSTVSQDEVDFLVEKELADLAQTYANTHGTCIQVFTNDAISQSFTKEGCDEGYKGTTVTYSVPAGKYSSTESKADANEMAQAEIDANGQAYANAPGNASCITDNTPHFFGDEDAPTQCQKSGGVNTGHVLILLTDINPNSPTYNQTMWADMGVNTDACPVPPCTGCTGESKKCINGVCETGMKIYTYSECEVPNPVLRVMNNRDSTSKTATMRPMYNGQCKMTYHYEWSDGSWSQSYTEYSGACTLGGIDCLIPID